MTITIFTKATTKGPKLYIEEPWPEETRIAKGLIEQKVDYLSVDLNNKIIHFNFQNGQASYTILSYDEFSDTFLLAYRDGVFTPRKELVT